MNDIGQEHHTKQSEMRTKPPEYDGSLINNWKPATIELVQLWCRRAHAPLLSEEDSVILAKDINHALLCEEFWHEKYKSGRESNLSTQRIKRIARALETLQIDLPIVLKDSRCGNPDGDLSLTEKLLELVNCHKPIIDAYPVPKRGRPQSLEKNLAANLATKVQGFWGAAAPAAAADAFAAEALTWLTGQPVPVSDEAIRKVRKRRTKKA